MKTQSRFVLATLVGAFFFASAAIAASVTAPAKFLGDAIQDGRAEVQLCNLALQKTTNPSVRAFAQQMLTEHTTANGNIEALAQRKNITLPKDISVKQKATYELLKHYSGTHFDEAFMDHNVSDHESDVKKFTEQANGATDKDVKDFAATTLATLKTHLQLAQDVDTKVKEAAKK